MNTHLNPFPRADIGARALSLSAATFWYIVVDLLKQLHTIKVIWNVIYILAYHHCLSSDKVTIGTLLINYDIDQSFCFDMVFKYVGDISVIITAINISNYA